MFIAPIGGFIYLRNSNMPDKSLEVKMKNKIYFQKEEDTGILYFIYDGRKYVNFDHAHGHWTAYLSKQIVWDKAVANFAWEDDNKFNVYSVIPNFMGWLFGDTTIPTLYTVKNSTDHSILVRVDDTLKILYCDEQLLIEKQKYYDNMTNYNYFVSYGKNGDENDCLPISEDAVKKTLEFTGPESFIPYEGREWFTLFGVSKDGIICKQNLQIILYNNELYLDSLVEAKIKLDKEQSEYFSSIIKSKTDANKNIIIGE
jgi:hypothetical protein